MIFFLGEQGPTFTADAVLGRDGFLIGAEASYNVSGGNITRYAAAVGYNAPEYAVTLHGLNNFNNYSASYYHRVSRDVEAGARALYDNKSTHGGVNLEVGTKMYLDSSAFVKAKINNAGVVALGERPYFFTSGFAKFISLRIHTSSSPWC